MSANDPRLLAKHVRKISAYEGITEGQAQVLLAAADALEAALSAPPTVETAQIPAGLVGSGTEASAGDVRSSAPGRHAGTEDRPSSTARPDPAEETEADRARQANDVAGVVFDAVKTTWPDLHPVLTLRYGVADALWARGYRRVRPVPEGSET